MKSKEFGPKIEEEETKEKEPELRLKIFFSTHKNERDFGALKKEVEGCDVYIPELSNYGPEFLKALRDISFGKLTPGGFILQYEAEHLYKQISDYIRGLFKTIYNSKKPIYLIDIPEEHELVFKSKEAERFNDCAYDYFLRGDFAAALANQRIFIKAYGKTQSEREKYIFDNIKKLKPEIIKDYPYLKNQEEIKILVSIGIGHTGLYHRLKGEKIPAQRQFSFLPFISSIATELIRGEQFFPGKDIDNRKLAQSLIEMPVELALHENKNINDSFEIMKIGRYLASKFNEKDVEKFSKMLGEKYSEIMNTSVFALPGEPKWQQTLEPFLEKFGVKFPETREEVKEIIRKVEKRGK